MKEKLFAMNNEVRNSSPENPDTLNRIKQAAKATVTRSRMDQIERFENHNIRRCSVGRSPLGNLILNH